MAVFSCGPLPSETENEAHVLGRMVEDSGSVLVWNPRCSSGSDGLSDSELP